MDETGFSLITPTFKNIGGTDNTLADLKGNFLSFESVQILDENAGTSEEYFFMKAEDSGAEADGWFMDDFSTPADNIPVPMGSSLLFASQGSASMTFAGEVSTEDVVVVSGANGFTMIGNATPAKVTLGQLRFTDIASFDSIQFMDNILSTENEYFFMKAEDSGAEADGWFMDDFATPADDVEIEAGTGVLFNAANGTSVTITIPAAL